MHTSALLPAGRGASRRWTRAGLAAAGLTTVACFATGCSVTSSSGATSSTTSSSAGQSSQTSKLLNSPESTALSATTSAPRPQSARLVALASSLSSAGTRTTAETIERATAAAATLVGGLGEAQRAELLRPAAASEEDAWLQGADSPGAVGVSLRDLDSMGQFAALGVVAALLNDDAYRTFTGILAADSKDAAAAGDANSSNYRLAFYGDPTAGDQPWTMVLSSASLGLSATLDKAANTIRFAPTRLGTSHLNFIGLAGMLRRPLNQASLSIKKFMSSLRDEQRDWIYQGEDVGSGLRCAEPSCDMRLAGGLSGNSLNSAQHQLLLSVISHWAGLSDQETTAAELDRISASLDETTIAYSGSRTFDESGNVPYHFVISGPDVYIECATQPHVDEPASSGADVFAGQDAAVQSVYRDPAS